MAINARSKGKANESVLAKEFTKWWNKLGCEFQRTDLIQTQQRSNRMAHGDIVPVIKAQSCIDATFPFSVEAKREEGWDFLFLVKGNPKSCFTVWWSQCVRDAELWNRKPLLVFGRNYAGHFAAYRSSDGKVLRDGKIFRNSAPPTGGIQALINGDVVRIITLKDFFETFEPVR